MPLYDSKEIDKVEFALGELHQQPLFEKFPKWFEVSFNTVSLQHKKPCSQATRKEDDRLSRFSIARRNRRLIGFQYIEVHVEEIRTWDFEDIVRSQ